MGTKTYETFTRFTGAKYGRVATSVSRFRTQKLKSSTISYFKTLENDSRTLIEKAEFIEFWLCFGWIWSRLLNSILNSFQFNFVLLSCTFSNCKRISIFLLDYVLFLPMNFVCLTKASSAFSLFLFSFFNIT